MSGAEVVQTKASRTGFDPLSGTKTPQGSGAASDADKELLFRPCKLGRYALRHRIVYACEPSSSSLAVLVRVPSSLTHPYPCSPLTRCRAANKGLVPQENAVEYYSQRARGCEGGLIISEATPICDTGHGYPCVPGIYTEEQIAGWKKVVQEVKRQGATFFMQLWHVGRTSHVDFQPHKAPPLSSMDVAAEGDVYLPDGRCEKFSKPQALDKSGISKLVNAFRQAARNAIDAGFDGVEVHGANGYIIDQFIKPKPNQRTDEYGGSIENRCRLVLEIVKAVVDEVGAERTGLRLSPYGQFGDVDDDNPNDTNIYLTKQLNQFDLAYIHVVEPRIAGSMDCDVRHESFSTQHFRNVWNGPFISAGGYNRERAIAALKSNHADMICMGRHYLANPDLPRRWREDAQLNKYNRDTFYTQGNEGYIDYPFLDGMPESAQKFFNS